MLTGALSGRGNHPPAQVKPWPYGFTGQYHDKETALVYFHARYYNPVIGHFMSSDSVVPNPSDTFSYDRYAYCRNNPVNLTDPSGHLFGIAALTIGKLVMMVLAAAVIGAVVANQSGGNVWQGALAGAITGFMTAVSAGTWAYFAASQSVNVALHATSGGQWLIAKVGNAIGSQVLGDMIVSSLLTGAVLKISGADATPVKIGKQGGKAEPGEIAASSQEEIQTRINELNAKPDLTPNEAKELSNLQKMKNAAKNALKDQNLMNYSATGGSFGSPVEDIRLPGPEGAEFAVPDKEVRVWFKVVKKAGKNEYQPIGISATRGAYLAKTGINLRHLAYHVSGASANPNIIKPYGGWSYLWFSGNCQNVTALGFNRITGVTVTPFMVTNNWSAMVTTGAYGYYGLYGGLFWRASEQYFYERAIS